MLIERFSERYYDEILLVTDHCVSDAGVDTNGGGGCYAIWGMLPCGLRVGASNGDMEGWGDDQCTWSVGLYHHGRQLAYLVAGSLADQLGIVGALTTEQAQALIDSTPESLLLPRQIIIVS
ncbi:hypothetical protein [Nocardia brasiliensis]|uniref:hypothetical protein n=1 Tax=Nocardia brasiliensis TaxID=37326 RepID=UPI0024550DD1|nr:hypothetical protein [Nocardia brasiliensis]